MLLDLHGVPGVIGLPHILCLADREAESAAIAGNHFARNAGDLAQLLEQLGIALAKGLAARERGLPGRLGRTAREIALRVVVDVVGDPVVQDLDLQEIILHVAHQPADQRLDRFAGLREDRLPDLGRHAGNSRLRLCPSDRRPDRRDAGGKAEGRT